LRNNDWAEGDLYEQMKDIPAENRPHLWASIAAFQCNNSNIWVFYQSESLHIIATMFDTGSKKWSFNVVVGKNGDQPWEIKTSQGSSLTAASVTVKNDHGAETFTIGWQGPDYKIWELRHDGNAWGTRRFSVETYKPRSHEAHTMQRPKSWAASCP
jgi:hypothetical protein